MNTRESAGGIVIGPDGRIILVYQHKNSWSLPKGGIEGGETALQAAVREIKEETGVVDLQLQSQLGSYERYSIGPGGVGETKEFGNQKRTFFLFKSNTLLLEPQDSEVTEARYVSLDEALLLLTHPKDRDFLESVRSKIRAVS